MIIIAYICAMALVIIAAAVSFAAGFYLGFGKPEVPSAKATPRPAKQPTEKQKKDAETFRRDYINMMTYDGTEQRDSDITGKKP